MLTTKQHIKETIVMAIPIVIGVVGHMLMGVIDTAMVGRVSPVHLAAASIANGLFFIIISVGIGISYAIAPLVSIQRGNGNADGCSKILHNGFYLNIAAGLVLALMNFAASDLIAYFGQTPEVTRLAISYSKILSFSAIPMMVFQTYRQFTEGLKIMRPAMTVAVAVNILHAALNYLLIYGKFGCPRLELDGAGWATLLSRICMAAAMFIYVFTSKRFNEFNLRLFPPALSRSISLELFKLGIASGMQYFFEVACFVFAAIMVGWIGAFPLAAHQIALNVASITYMAVVGVSSAAAIRTGNFLGSGSKEDMKRAGYIALMLGAGFMSISGIVMILLRNIIPSFYVEDAAVQQIASALLVIAAMFQIFDGLQAVGLGVLRGTADAKMPTLITFVAYWVVGIPAAYLFGFIWKYGVIGIWIGLLIGLAFSAIMLTVRVTIKVRIK
jgi:MATE family multidrug resistance protein